MIIVVAAVEIGRHHRDEVAAVLLAIGLAQLDGGDLGDGIPLVGRLQRAAEQRVLGHRLRRQPRINAGRAERQQLLDAGLVRAADDIERDRQIDGDEIGGKSVVGMNAADQSGGQESRIRPHLRQPVLGGRLIGQVERAPLGDQDLRAFIGQPAHNRRAHHAVMAGDINALAGKIEQRGRGQRFSLNCATVRVSYKAARAIWLDIFRRSKPPRAPATDCR